MSCWEAIKYLFAFAHGALCFYLWDQIHVEIPIDEINLREISFEEDDEFAHGTPIDEDFDQYSWTEYIRRTTPESGWYSCAVPYEQFMKTKMEIFYGR